MGINVGPGLGLATSSDKTTIPERANAKNGHAKARPYNPSTVNGKR
ncbi:MAG: hypothetical protein IJU62_06905 [Muribaculaceae bacterium]|nr:hypothetical protein [Muribaculaceae bacterium]